MSKSAPSPPAAPSAAATAAAQGSMNKDTALWNAIMGNANQITPYGNLTWTKSADTYDQKAYDDALTAYNAKKYHTPDEKLPTLSDFKNAPQFTSTITLSPEQQKLLDTQQRSGNALASLGEQQIGRITDAVSTPYSYSGLGDAPSQQDIATASQRAEDALYSRLNPQFQRDEEALRTRLINQGIGQGSEAYNREMDTFNQAKNDARMQAILQGSAYGGQLQNQAMDRRNQAIQEYNAQRNAPLNEYTAMMSGQQVQNPSFSASQSGNAQSPDYMSAVNNQYQSQMDQYNARVAGQNNMTNSLFGLGGSLLMAPMTGGGSLFGNAVGRFARRG